MKGLNVKIIVTLSIYLILIGGLVYFGIFPYYGKLTKSQAEFNDTEEKLVASQEKFDDLVKLKKDEVTIGTVKKNVSSYLPDDKSIPDFIVQVEAFANTLSMPIATMNITEPKVQTAPKASADESDTATTSSKTATTTAPATTAPVAKQTNNYAEFALTFNTNYATAEQFIVGLGKIMRLNTIESINFSSYNIEKDTLDTRITGRIYYGK